MICVMRNGEMVSVMNMALWTSGNAWVKDPPYGLDQWRGVPKRVGTPRILLDRMEGAG